MDTTQPRKPALTVHAVHIPCCACSHAPGCDCHLRSNARASLDCPRLRFNWGYHDGANDAQKQRARREVSKHPDQVYAVGYHRGFQEASDGVYTNDSSESWAGYSAWRAALSGSAS